MRFLLSFTLLLVLQLAATTSLAAQQARPLLPPQRTAVAKKQVRAFPRQLNSSAESSAPTSPCAGVPAMPYFEIDDVFTIVGRGLVAGGVLHEGVIDITGGPVTLYAVNERRLRYAIESNRNPLDRAQALVKLKQDPESYLVTVKGIEQKRRPFHIILPGTESWGLHLSGVTRAELTRDHVLVDFERFVDRYSRCKEMANVRPVRLGGGR